MKVCFLICIFLKDKSSLKVDFHYLFKAIKFPKFDQIDDLQINGYGIDLRQRKTWTRFVGTDLREKTLDPSKDLLRDCDFLIGNHTDELTPWIPVMAARFLFIQCLFYLYKIFTLYYYFQNFSGYWNP